MMKISKNILLLLLFSLVFACQTSSKKKLQSDKWPISSYNFGELEDLSIPDQVALLSNSGYQGLILKSASKQDFDNFEEYLRATENTENIKLDAVFERYRNKDETERRERWKIVVDRIAKKDIQLWVIYGKDGFDDAFIEEKTREIAAYAAQKNVDVIIYPHSGTFFESSEEALPMVDKIDLPNLMLAFHLYHEIRAGNGSRIPEVFENIRHRLGAVTLAGTDSIADFTTKFTRDTTTIKPLSRGNYDMKKFIEVLDNSGYNGSVGFMNFKLKHPEIYLPESKKIWDNYINEQ